MTLVELEALISSKGDLESAYDLVGRPAAERAWVALKRLGKAHVAPERVLTITLAFWALIEDDAGSHRTVEFRNVQIAKALHRLASGTHRTRSGFRLPSKYPRSSGLVLRIIGAKVTAICELLARAHVPAIIQLKTQKFGEHPSRLPGWKQPLWRVPPRGGNA